MFAPYKPAKAYSNIHVETGVHGADAHQLISMLLDGALTQIAQAVSALERGDIAAMLRGCSELLTPMRDAWNTIRPQRIAA